MRKNRIRLTESQLHKVIKESVKQVLSELDWKTYANAAKKAEKRRDSRKDSFLKKATQEINKTYPYRHSHSNHYVDGKENGIPDYQEDVWFNPYLQTKYGYMNANSSSDSCATAPRWWDNSEYHKSFGDRGTKAWSKGEDVTGYHKGMQEQKNIGTPDDNWDVHTYANGSRDNWGDESNDLRWDWDAMSDDMENYYSGKSKYKKGKGWQ